MKWFLLFVLVYGRAEAACLTLNFLGVGATQTYLSSGILEYKPYDAATHMQTVSFNVTSLVNVGTCSFFVALKAGQSGNAGARKLSTTPALGYQAYTDVGMGSVLLPASGSVPSGNVVVGGFPNSVGLLQSMPLSFYWTMAPEQVLAATGTRYSDSGVALELYEGAPGGSYTLRDTVNMTFRTKIESSVDIAIAASGGTYGSGGGSGNVNFGTPVTGATRGFDLSVRSNDGYLVTLQSAKKQKLERVASSTIPYTLTVSGNAVNLSGGTAVTVANQHGGTTPVNGTNLPVVVTLGTVTGLEAPGMYQDVVSVGVSAN